MITMGKSIRKVLATRMICKSPSRPNVPRIPRRSKASAVAVVAALISESPAA
jgi:hypothetical protein